MQGECHADTHITLDRGIADPVKKIPCGALRGSLLEELDAIYGHILRVRDRVVPALWALARGASVVHIYVHVLVMEIGTSCERQLNMRTGRRYAGDNTVGRILE